ncbi:MFS general substrate transporter [Rickenella mellea]|uniref:MFS general substrate transporter n=1 Tax=Rickenella mellea TaxID=50990 RepID=A0A4Y7Q4W1_9AGAM|nr:MFS general substrate transporter [Rickenella mellea]
MSFAAVDTKEADEHERERERTEATEGSTRELGIEEVDDEVDDAHQGVKKVEAAERVYGKYTKWILFVSLGLASYIYALDSSTTPAYLAFASSAFGEHSLISSIQVAQSIIIAVGKPVIAKVADVTSRASAYLAVLIFYVIGYIVIASAQNVGTIAGGIVIYAVYNYQNNSGLQLLTQIIIADTTTLKHRGLLSSLVSLPFVVNAFIGPNISSRVLNWGGEGAGWRWGYGMFAILVPISLAPLIGTLFWAEHKARKLGVLSSPPSSPPSPTSPTLPTSPTYQSPHPHPPRYNTASSTLDLTGLVLLGGAVALILLPLTLSQTVRRGWKDPRLPILLVLGIILLVLFALWDLRYASRPVVAPRFVRNRSIVFACCVGFFDFMSFYLTFTYLYTFVLVVKPWSLLQSTYFMQTQTVALTVFGICAGFSMWWFRRYKFVLMGGLCVRLLGVGLMIHSRGANASTIELVWTQILQGIGGGLAAASAQVGAQASVPHADVAIVTAVVLLVTEIGGAIGGAVAGAIWTNTMPDRLVKYLPFLSENERAKLFGDITSVLSIPRGDPTREGVIHAYDDTMKVMVIVATGLSVIPIITSCFMPNWYLGDTQNAVDNADLSGERREPNPHHNDM